MTTPYGTIAFSDLNTEIGYSSTTQRALNDPGVRYLSGAEYTSGSQISMSNLQGQSINRCYISVGDNNGTTINRNFPNVESFAYWENTLTVGGNVDPSYGVFQNGGFTQYFNGYYWALFTDNTVKRSHNGTSWSTVTSIPGGNAYSSIGFAAIINGYIVLCDLNGNFYYSSDGSTWYGTTITSDLFDLGISNVTWGSYNGNYYWVATGYDVTQGAISFFILNSSGAPSGSWTRTATLPIYAGNYFAEIGSMQFYNNQLVYTIDEFTETTLPKIFFLDSGGSSWYNTIDFSSLQTGESWTTGLSGVKIGSPGNVSFVNGYLFAIFPGAVFSPGGLYYTTSTTLSTSGTSQWTQVSGFYSGQPNYMSFLDTNIILVNNGSTVYAATSSVGSWSTYVGAASFYGGIVY